MASLKELRNRIASVDGDPEDHQGDAHGRGGQAAPRARGGGERPALRRAHGGGDRQPGGRASPAPARRRSWSGPVETAGAGGRGHRRPGSGRRLQLLDRPRRARPHRPADRRRARGLDAHRGAQGARPASPRCMATARWRSWRRRKSRPSSGRIEIADVSSSGSRPARPTWSPCSSTASFRWSARSQPRQQLIPAEIAGEARRPST